MVVPTPGQRWVSQTEPELGLGEILEVSGRTIAVHFPATDVTRQYAAGSAPLRRVRFHPGQEVRDRQGDTFVVESIDERDGLLLYRGSDRLLPEDELCDQIAFNEPSDRLLNGHTDPTKVFDLRRQSLWHQSRILGSPLRGFVGGRVDLIPHQFFVAQEVAERHAPRVLLADEVGLGKTIEACLILHRLLLTGRVERVLLLAPQALLHQWMVELKRRFNLLVSLYDEERCVAIESMDSEANPFLEEQLILTSVDLFVDNPRRAVQAEEASWDMLVVDEAHLLRWSPEEKSPEYEVVERLASATPSLILITATPEQLGRSGHFARLHLLDPRRYASLDDFLKETRQQPRVAELAETLLSEKALEKGDLDGLLELLPHQKEQLTAERSLLEGGDVTVRRRWARNLLDLHGPGRVMMRNRRAALRGFPKRMLHRVELLAEAVEDRERLSRELTGELAGTQEDSELDYTSDKRVEWLLNLLQEHGDDKVLLICTSRDKVLALDEALRQRANVKTAVFHEALTIVQLDRHAAYFAEPDGAQILLCSEIGSEGRNFQFAHRLVLFDLPLDPDLLEQRIGRLDRIGQKQDVHLYVPYVKGTAQEVLLRWHHEGGDALDRSTGTGTYLLERFADAVRQLIARAAAGDLVEADLNELVAATVEFRKAAEEELESGRDRVIELTSYRPGETDDLLETIRDQDDDADLESFLLRLFEHFGVHSLELQPRSHLLNPDALSIDKFPELEAGDTVITFDRASALARWDAEFLGIDHPLLHQALDTLLLSETGNSAFALWEDRSRRQMLLEAIFVVESLAPAHLFVERFIPPTPVRVVVDHKKRELKEGVSPAQLARALVDGDPGWLSGHSTQIQNLIPPMTEEARQLAEKRLPKLLQRAEAEIERLLVPEVDRLELLARVNDHVRPEEIERAREYVAQVSKNVQTARLRLQALRLIWRGPCDGRVPVLR